MHNSTIHEPDSSASSTVFHPTDTPATATAYESRTNLHDPHLSHHDPNRPDLSFPFQSTNIQQGGFTDEYRAVTRSGFINASHALRPIPTHHSTTPAALLDPEKARALKHTKLVTFVPDDPEDPRNYSNCFKWCKFASPVILGSF